FGLALIGLVASSLLLAAKMSSLPDEVALWYTQPAAQRLAPAVNLWLLPGITAFSLGLNSILGYLLYRRYQATSRLLVSLSAAISLLGLVAVMQTLLIYTTLL